MFAIDINQKPAMITQNLVPVDLDEPLSLGDIIQLHYKTIGGVWFKAAQLAIIENQLRKRKDFYLESVYSPQDTSTVIITVRIVKPAPDEQQIQQAGAWTVAIIVSIIAAAIGLVAYISFEGAYKVGQVTKEVIESPAGKVLAGGVGTLALAAGIGALIALFTKAK